MKQYKVDGMSCASCVAHVEKAVNKLDGVQSVSVNLLTGSMSVEGEINPAIVEKAVSDAGYQASCIRDTNKNTTERQKELQDTETPKLRRRLWQSVLFLLPLLYITMGHGMLAWPLPEFFEQKPLVMALCEMVLTLAIMVINRSFFISGIKSACHKAPNMDTLVALGAGVSFLYSLYLMLQQPTAMESHLYFESAAMILTLITVGKTLEAFSKGKTTSAVQGLMSLIPKMAMIEQDGKKVQVPVENVKPEDIFYVAPGESIPVDGIILEGEGAVDESALTGESIPADKAPGDAIVTGTLNQSGYFKGKATHVGEDTALAKIIQMVSDTGATKAPIAKTADRVAGIFVPAVLGIAAVTAVLWLIAGQSADEALTHAITVLVISCPCALGLATPVAIMVGSGLGAKNGILFKTAAALEETGRATMIVLDKTGTITQGKPIVTNVIPTETTAVEELLETALALEEKSEHPLAKAVVYFVKAQHVFEQNTEKFTVFAGNGVTAEIAGKKGIAGKEAFLLAMQKQEADKENIQRFIKENRIRELEANGKTILYFAKDTHFLGAIAVADTIKPESQKAIQELKKMGLYTVMLTGDNERTARAIGKEVKIDDVIAGVLPDEKEQVIEKLQTRGTVIMVGDGINDAPALNRANVGFAIGAGVDIAMDAADVILVNSRMTDVSAAIRLGRGTLRNIHENLFWAFIYNLLGIPLAAGLYTSLFGWSFGPMFGAAAMSLSSVCVVSNALRLNLLPLQKDGHFKKKRTIETIRDIDFTDIRKEEKKMTKTIYIEGMMCEHCEAHVKEALEKISGVTVNKISHTEKLAVITIEKPVTDETLIQAVRDAGYKVESIEN